MPVELAALIPILKLPSSCKIFQQSPPDLIRRWRAIAVMQLPRNEIAESAGQNLKPPIESNPSCGWTYDGSSPNITSEHCLYVDTIHFAAEGIGKWSNGMKLSKKGRKSVPSLRTRQFPDYHTIQGLPSVACLSS